MLVRSEDMENGVYPQIVLAGACNLINANGDQVRNEGRDELARWLDIIGIRYFEVQIHPDTHGRGYNWEVDGPREKQARAQADLRVYEIRPDIASHVTMMEILDDARRGRQSIVWFHDGGASFSPAGLGDRNEVRANRDHLVQKVGRNLYAHLEAYVNGGRQVRSELKAMLADGDHNILFVEGDLEALKTRLYENFAL